MLANRTIDLRSPARPPLGSQGGGNLVQIEIGGVHLSDETLWPPGIDPDKVTRSPVAPNEAFVALDHPDIACKLTPARRALPQQWIAHLPRSEQLTARLDAPEERPSARQPADYPAILRHGFLPANLKVGVI